MEGRADVFVGDFVCVGEVAVPSINFRSTKHVSLLGEQILGRLLESL